MLLLGSPFLPETPRWLLSKGRTADAIHALESIRPALTGDKARALVATVKKQLDAEAMSADASWSGLLKWPKRYRLYLGMGVMVG